MTGNDIQCSRCVRTNPGGPSKIGCYLFGSLTVMGRHTCALKENGNAVCWGKEISGQTTVPTP